MDFGKALELCKMGHKIAREGWNGKDMFVVFQVGYPDGININKNTATALGKPEGTFIKFRPYLMMYTAQKDCVPWVASQTDILAEDWTTLIKQVGGLTVWGDCVIIYTCNLGLLIPPETCPN